jgi:hypothetical protein
MSMEWYFGFHAPWRDWHGMFGHCEAWGYDEDQTWVFLDPQSTGFRVRTLYRDDEVIEALADRHAVCRLILRTSAKRPFALPVHGPMTCASICGSLVGIRALFPAGLARKLLAQGAEVVHGQAQGRPRGQEGPATPEAHR